MKGAKVMDIFDKYEIAGIDFDNEGVMHIRFVEKGTSPDENAPTTKIEYGFNESGNLKGELA